MKLSDYIGKQIIVTDAAGLSLSGEAGLVEEIAYDKQTGAAIGLWVYIPSQRNRFVLQPEWLEIIGGYNLQYN